MGAFDWLFNQPPQLQPNEAAYMADMGNLPNSANPLLQPRRDAALSGLWGGLSQLGAGLAAAGQRRPVNQPGPTAGQAFGAVPQAVAQGQQRAWQQQQVEDAQRRQDQYARLIAGLPQGQQQLFGAVDPGQGAQMLLASQLRPQGRMGTPEEHQAAGLPMGTLYFDQTNRPHVLQTPQLSGLNTTAQETARAPFHPTVLPPGGTIIENPGLQGQPNVPGVSGALPQLARAESGNNPAAVNPDTGAAGTYQFTPSTWSWLRQANPQFGQRYTQADITNPRAQAEAAPLFERTILQRNQDLLGRSVNGVQVTPDALVRGGWLGGPDGVRRYIETNGEYNPADANGTRIGDYFAGTARNMRGGGQVAAQAAPESYVSAPALPPGIPPEMMRPTPQASAPTPSTIAGNPGGPRVLAQSPNPAPGTTEAMSNQEYGKHNQARLNTTADQTVSSMQVVTSLREMRNLIDQGLQTGSGADARQSIANFLRTFGVAPDLANTIMGADSRAYQAQAGQLVLALLGGRLGAQISDSDRGAIERIVPQLYDNPESARRLMDILDRRHNQTIQNNISSYERSLPNGADPTRDQFLNQYRIWREQNPETVAAPARQQAAPAPATDLVPQTAPATLPPTTAPAAPATPQSGAGQPRRQSGPIPGPGRITMMGIDELIGLSGRTSEMSAAQRDAVSRRLRELGY